MTERVWRGRVAKHWGVSGCVAKKVRKISRKFLPHKTTSKPPKVRIYQQTPPDAIFYTFAFKRVNGEFVLRACLSSCVCCAVPGAVLAVVGALWLARLLLSRSPRIVNEAGVLEVSGKDREAKQSKRRGFCRLGKFGRYLLGSQSQEADKKFSAKLSKS